MDATIGAILVIAAVGLALFGSTRLPGIARSLGKVPAYFKAGRLEAEKELGVLEAEAKQSTGR